MLTKVDVRVGLERRVYQACDVRMASRRLTKLTSDLHCGLVRTLKYYHKNSIRGDLERFSTIKPNYINLNTNNKPILFPNGDPVSFADVRFTLVTPNNQLVQSASDESGVINAGSVSTQTDRWGNLSVNLANNATMNEETRYRIELPALDIDGDLIYVPLTETGTVEFNEAWFNRGHKFKAQLSFHCPLEMDIIPVFDIGFNLDVTI